MKFFNRLSISWLMLMLFLQLSTINSLHNGITVSSRDLGTPQFNHLAIHKDMGIVFIGAVNGLYKLTPDLQLLSNVETPSGVDDLMNYNQVLVIDYEGNQLIACESSHSYTCAIYDFIANSSAFTRTKQNKIKSFSQKDGANASSISFIGKTNIGQDGDKISDLFLASAHYNDRAVLDPLIKVITFKNNFNTKTKFRNEYIKDRFSGKYVHGFNSGIYNYFLTAERSSREQTDLNISKLIRICYNSDDEVDFWQGYTEIPIECKYDNEQPFKVVEAAHVGKPGLELQRLLNIGRDDDVLFAVFSKSQTIEITSNKPSHHSALCIYTLKAIDEKFTENIQNCFNGSGYYGSVPEFEILECEKNYEKIGLNFCSSKKGGLIYGDLSLTASPVITLNTLLTAITTKPDGNYNDVFVGTNTGHLKKIMVSNTSNANEIGDLPIDEGSPVNPDL
ncbi:hypothetical protein U1Q18_050440, partial [Sarracenia purpurea var. burkii]